jgi:Tfp pilus assembly protein PilF
MGEPLNAEHEYEKAVRLDPSEQNYFAWGAELLTHRAVQPAIDVFTNGTRAHPKSARMLAGLGAALYARGSYDEAARTLCTASDLQPTDSTPYLLLGEMQQSAPAPLGCAEERLARFAQQQPGNAMANYLYAVALWKSRTAATNDAHLSLAQTLLEKSVSIDPNLAAAHLQLGIVYSVSREEKHAIEAYKRAIAADPQLTDAHYRLAVAYQRVGENAKAEQEFRAYEQLDKSQSAAVEQQRRQIRQFLVVLTDRTPMPR